MNEALLHFIWKFRLFDTAPLTTTRGEEVTVIHPGMHNTDAGADFQQAKIRIGETLWAGNVELHVDARDWFTHGHHQDEAYNNVVLHVVYQPGERIAFRKNSSEIPTVVLKDHIKETTLARYGLLSETKSWIPCEHYFPSVSDFTKQHFYERLLIERLEQKVEAVNTLLHESENDWEQVMFCMIAKYFGAGINREPFFLLAGSLPVKLWAKHAHDRLQLEALVFGQAGLLEDPFDDDYPNQLKREFNYLKRLYHLKPLPRHVWKFLRLRPANFPTLRLAQLAALMNREVKLFSAVRMATDVKALHQLFEVEVSDYWNTHFLFDKPSAAPRPNTGSMLHNTLVINAVVPVLFAYGKYKHRDEDAERAVHLLETSRPENNSIINSWKALGQSCAHAFDSQALLQLKNEYCNRFRCLECAIGTEVLK